MASYNKKLESLTLDDIERISEEYLKGWRKFSNYGFQLKGLNRRRREFGLPNLTDEWSKQYRVKYIKNNFSNGEIYSEIREYLLHHKTNDTRWTGIEVLDCCFHKEHVQLFRQLLGKDVFDDLSEYTRVEKLKKSQIDLYGGVGLAGDKTKAKAKATIQNRYGVDNPMQIEEVKNSVVSPFTDEDIKRKARITKLMNKKMKKSQSSAEKIAYNMLVDRFGIDDVVYEYGVHPFDPRYPFSCDFYIRSQDLFIELNIEYSHGNHWYDSNNHDDRLRLQHLIESKSERNRKAAEIWSIKDVEKRKIAKDSNLKYLVFWDKSQKQINKKRILNISDFKCWMDEYNADYKAFIQDHPENTY